MNSNMALPEQYFNVMPFLVSGGTKEFVNANVLTWMQDPDVIAHALAPSTERNQKPVPWRY